MFFDQLIPDTSSYMVAGYVLFFVITAIYLASLVVRSRNLARDLDTLRGLEKEQDVAAAPAPAKASKPRVAKAKAPAPKTARRKIRQQK